MHYIIFDLEATCWEGDKSKPNEIIEIGALKLNEHFEIVDEFQAFVKPVLYPELSDFCKKLTSITQQEVDGANTFNIVSEQFKIWMGRSYLLCSWGKYDKNQLQKDCILHQKDFTWTKRHISLKHQYIDQYKVSKRNAGMGAALRQFGLPLVGTHHRGIDDARNIAAIFIANRPNWILKP